MDDAGREGGVGPICGRKDFRRGNAKGLRLNRLLKFEWRATAHQTPRRSPAS